MEFTTYRFKDCIAEIIDNRGRNPDKYYDSEKYPVIDNYLIKNELHPVVENANRFLSQSQFDNFLRGYVTKDDLLMTLVGNGIGNVSLSPNDKIAIVQNTVGFRLNQELLDSYFAFYYFKTINSAVRNLDRGASQPSVNRTDVLRLKIQVPTINTQKQIADVLSTYDKLIENNNKRIKLLEQMAENLYKEWFVRFRFPNHENTEFENGIPKGWEYVKLGEYANISTGKCNREDAEEDGIYPLFDRSQEIKKSSVWLKDCEAIIVPGEGTSFIPRYYKGKFNLHQRCYCVEPKIRKTGKFLFYTLMLNRIYFLYVATGATVPSLRQNNFTNMKIIMPKMELVNKYDDVVSSFIDEINSLKERNENLIKQRDLLLPRLMSGKLEV